MRPIMLPLNSNRHARLCLGDLANIGVPFTNSNGTLRGVQGRPDRLGRLPQSLWHHARYATFTVFSYNTPIAWRRPDGAWIIPDVSYSVTTAKHQGYCRVALHGLSDA